MKNPREYTLAEIEVIIRSGLVPELSMVEMQHRFQDLLKAVEMFQSAAHAYQVNRDQVQVRERVKEAAPRPRQCSTMDSDLLNSCVLVSE